MAHIMRKNAGREIKMISELFIIKNSEYTFVLFVSDQSLLTKSLQWQQLWESVAISRSKFSQIDLKITKIFRDSKIQMQLHKIFGKVVQYARAVLINISSLKHSSWTFWRLHAIWNYAMVSFILKLSTYV